MKKIFTFLLLFLLVINSLQAQVDTTQPASAVIEDLVEQIVQTQDLEDFDYADLYDELMYFYQHKINLNTATREQLEKLRFLSDDQINAILDYRKSTGEFISIYELQLLPGFSRDVISMLLPFVTVAKPEQAKTVDLNYMLGHLRHDVIFRQQAVLVPQVGYLLPDSVDNRYLGDRQKIYLRYKVTFRQQLSAGFTAEKDAGEQFFAGAQKYGFDFYSAHLELKGLSKHLLQLNVGDFMGKFGQGLVLWNGFSMGKSAYVLNVRRRPQGLRKYSSTDENRFFRGAGVTFGFGNVQVSTFASYKKIDGNMQPLDTAGEEFYVSSLLETGYHRTPSEIEDRHTVSEYVSGLGIRYSGKHWNLGFTSLAYKWSVPFVQSDVYYRMEPVSADFGANAGVNWYYLSHRMSFFGEAAMDNRLNPALLAGVTLPMNYRLEAVMLYRYYSPGYFAYYGSAFGETSRLQNEQGLYTGVRVLPAKGFVISAYFDRYSFPWFAYRISEPMTWGNDVFLQADYMPSRHLSMYVRWKHELKPQNLTGDTLALPLVLPVETSKFRYHLSYRLNDQLSLKTRVELSFYRKDEIERGFMMYQDIKYSSKALPLTVYWRFAVFDAPYDARIYAYENDVLYAFSVPAYFYQGFRTYLLLKYKLNDGITFWLRYSQTTYTDRDVIAEGSLNQINGNTKPEIKFQVRVRL